VPGTRPPPSHPVKLDDSRFKAQLVAKRHRVDGDRLGRVAPEPGALIRLDGRLFDHALPLAAVRAFSHPLWRLVPAGLTTEQGFRIFSHEAG